MGWLIGKILQWTEILSSEILDFSNCNWPCRHVERLESWSMRNAATPLWPIVFPRYGIWTWLFSGRLSRMSWKIASNCTRIHGKMTKTSGKRSTSCSTIDIHVKDIVLSEDWKIHGKHGWCHTWVACTVLCWSMWVGKETPYKWIVGWWWINKKVQCKI